MATNTSTRQRVPAVFNYIAAELHINLGDEQHETDDLEELVAFIRFCIDAERAEAVEHFDELHAQLDQAVNKLQQE